MTIFKTCDPDLLVCFKKSNNKKGYTENTGYHCVNELCIQCPVGSYGPDGINCYPCPFATWAPQTGQTTCNSTLIYSTAGLHSAYIPFGVNKINIKLWGAGGGGGESSQQNFDAHTGGGGGYTSCNITVPMSQNTYVTVGGGGGGGNGTMKNFGGQYGKAADATVFVTALISLNFMRKSYLYLFDRKLITLYTFND